MAVPMTSAFGISWRKISSVPFNSSFTSSTMMTLNFFSSIFSYSNNFLCVFLLFAGNSKVNGKPALFGRLRIDAASSASGKLVKIADNLFADQIFRSLKLAFASGRHTLQIGIEKPVQFVYALFTAGIGEKKTNKLVFHANL